MPAIFVHGVPDTARVWHRVLDRLTRRDVVTLALPGFGAPLPPGFEPTKDGYAAWLVAELARQPPPVDVVGHDWGGLLVVRAVSLAPGVARSWAAGAAPLDPDCVWHRAAQIWQTPGAGERFMETLTAPDLARALAAAAVPPDDAAEAARHVDETMKACILRLYRSAVTVGREWLADLERVRAPGVVLWGEHDPYAAAGFGARLAERTRARLVSFPGCGHWWPLERPAEVAAELEALWGRVEGTGG
jgi:pimeloyl-ACP methyl ester carboxylesterase